jgi:hypothetical protein
MSLNDRFFLARPQPLLIRAVPYFMGFMALVAVVFLVIGGPKWDCQNRWGSSFETRYDYFGGCKVKVGDKFWPEERVRATDVQ